MIKIAVIGSRIFADYQLFEEKLLHYLVTNDINCGSFEIFSGGANGTDTLATMFASKFGICIHNILPDYKKFGRGAPIVRNKQIVESADAVVAFWDLKSKGTRFVIDYAKKKEKKVKIYEIA